VPSRALQGTISANGLCSIRCPFPLKETACSSAPLPGNALDAGLSHAAHAALEPCASSNGAAASPTFCPTSEFNAPPATPTRSYLEVARSPPCPLSAHSPCSLQNPKPPWLFQVPFTQAQSPCLPRSRPLPQLWAVRPP
jgi:hypothetical protein